MKVGLIGKKLGMTQLFQEDGKRIPVSVLKIDPCVVVGIKTLEKDGYDAVLLGTWSVKESRVHKPQREFFRKSGLDCLGTLKEFRDLEASDLKVGDSLGVERLTPGTKLDVRGVTIGKGFAGAMKRHRFGGLRASHGVSVSHRSIGSTGNRTQPGKVFKNKRMPGRMGGCNRWALNLELVSVDQEKNVAFFRGSVPGHKNGTVYIRNAVKGS
jgi:large subunit ribosomal protein L3